MNIKYLEIKSKSVEYGFNVQFSNDYSSVEKAIITGEQELINANSLGSNAKDK